VESSVVDGVVVVDVRSIFCAMFAAVRPAAADENHVGHDPNLNVAWHVSVVGGSLDRAVEGGGRAVRGLVNQSVCMRRRWSSATMKRM
jgi:hypothetical protein